MENKNTLVFSEKKDDDDDDGPFYKQAEEYWSTVPASVDGVMREQKKEEGSFYKRAADYWSSVPATVDGMLGGFGFVSHTDIQGSLAFLKLLFKLKQAPGKSHALDCGAGIGRITKNLLIPVFDKVDLVEQDPKFISEAKSYIGNTKKIGQFFNQGLQNFCPEPHTYDVIWCQWVLGHLTDIDFVAFFKGCIKGLKDNGVIVVKENITSSDSIEVDDQDSSVTRPLSLIHKLFQEATLQCIKEAKQNNFPRGLYAVKMFALRPV